MSNPPRLLARTLTVTFLMVAVILTIVFIVITLGALYGTAILTSLTILTARISVLVRGA